MNTLSAISWRHVTFQWDDDDDDDDGVPFVLDQHVELDFYSASSLKQQSAWRHIVPLGHIILIPSKPVCLLTPECCVLSSEATNTSFICLWIDLTTNYRIRGDAVFEKLDRVWKLCLATNKQQVTLKNKLLSIKCCIPQVILHVNGAWHSSYTSHAYACHPFGEMCIDSSSSYTDCTSAIPFITLDQTLTCRFFSIQKSLTTLYRLYIGHGRLWF